MYAGPSGPARFATYEETNATYEETNAEMIENMHYVPHLQ
jgi:hypothetical protein